MAGKHFLHKMNRGLFLGLVLLVGLTVFIVVDEIQFEGQRKEVQSTLEQYMQDISQISIFPEEYRIIGKPVPNTVVEEKKQKIDTVIEQYGIDAKTSEHTASEWKQIVDFNAAGKGYVTDWKGSLEGRQQISKEGPGQVKVDMTYQVFVDFVGIARTNDLFSVISMDRDLNQGNKGKNENPDQEHRLSLREGRATFLMERRDGQWKWKEFQGSSYGYEVK